MIYGERYLSHLVGSGRSPSDNRFGAYLSHKSNSSCNSFFCRFC